MPSEAAEFLQGDVADFFRRAAAGERLAHAYLFLGPVGVGKSQFAKELAKFLFCLDRKSDPSPGTLGSCGVCRNCRRVDHGNLPDLHWFERQEGKRDIIMEDIDRFQREMSFKPVEGPWKVFVIQEADRLNLNSANHMLKVLEEPPDYALILLLAEEEEDILPTIRSRVHVVRFRPQPVAELAKALAREHGAGRDEAMFLARLSAGSPGLALSLKEQGFYERHRRILDRVRAMTPSDNFAVSEAFQTEIKQALELADDKPEQKGDEQEEQGGQPRDPKGQRRRELNCLHLDGLMLAFRDDLEREAAGGDTARLDRLQNAVKALIEASEAISLNANTRLVLDNLMFQVASRR